MPAAHAITKMGIGGIKLSDELILIHQVVPADLTPPVPFIYRQLAAERINVRFLILTVTAERTDIVCCVDGENAGRVEQIVNLTALGENYCFIVPAVGLVSIFPHQGRSDMLNQGVKTLARAGIRYYAAAASIAAFTFVVDADSQDEAVGRFRQEFALPETHVPFRPSDARDESMESAWRVIASYQESKIKTYGFQKVPGLRLVTPSPKEKTGEWMAACFGPPDPFTRLYYMAGHFMGKSNPGLCFAVNRDDTAMMEDRLTRRGFAPPRGAHPLPATAADLVFFQGPHFGDRYGIVDRALTVLADARVPLLTAACAEASIFMLFPAETSESAVKALETVFIKP